MNSKLDSETTPLQANAPAPLSRKDTSNGMKNTTQILMAHVNSATCHIHLPTPFSDDLAVMLCRNIYA